MYRTTRVEYILDTKITKKRVHVRKCFLRIILRNGILADSKVVEIEAIVRL